MYSKIIILFAWTVIMNSADDKEPGRMPKRIDFSIHGHQVRPGEWPHHVLIYKLYDIDTDQYRAFCSGSIISIERVISSANCYFTNRKNFKMDFGNIWIGAGEIKTVVYNPTDQKTEDVQWRQIDNIFSQRLYRYPAYNLAILVLEKPFLFNEFINSIPFESEFHDFDGICIATSVKATKSWSLVKYVYTEPVQMIPRRTCENIFLRNCRNYFCTIFKSYDKYVFSESEGSGLVCQITGDPNEVNETQGILVGVTSVINVGLPSLHVRIGNHANWVRDNSCTHNSIIYLLILCVVIIVLNE